MTPELLKGAAKAGYASRGVVYLLLGGLALASAIGSGGRTTDTKGALLELFDTGFGVVAFVVLGLGFLCYAAWRLVQSLADADDHGTDAKGLAVRGGLLVSAISHSALGIWALYAALSQGSRDSGGGGKDGIAAWILSQPFGPWLLGLVGLAILGAGGAHIVKGATRGFEKWFEADETKMKAIRPFCIVGLISRGIVFIIIGGFFGYAAFTVDPDKAGGVREALEWLRGQDYGTALFALAAFGLVCFGIYSFIESVYRKINAAEAVSQARPA